MMIVKNVEIKDFPGGPVAKTPCLKLLSGKWKFCMCTVGALAHSSPAGPIEKLDGGLETSGHPCLEQQVVIQDHFPKCTSIFCSVRSQLK